MKKLSIILLLIFIYATKFLPTEEESAYKTLDNHFKRHFKEEFKIKYFSKRKMGRDFWYEAEVYPKRFIGTVKEYDSYYHGQGFVGKNKQPGDTYGGVILNEGANEYYRPKLEELFGKNVLPVLTVKGSYNDRVPSFEKEKENGELTSLEGGIYIFGRVENEADREKYRESIYKFIQYLKETNSFDYSDIVIKIYDERALTNSYLDVVNKLKELRKNEKTSKLYKEKREELLDVLNNEFKSLKEENIEQKLGNIEKENMLGENGWTNIYSYSQIYHIAITSAKFKESSSFFRGEKLITYEKINDIKLFDSFKIKYSEYDEEEIKKGTWGD